MEIAIVQKSAAVHGSAACAHDVRVNPHLNGKSSAHQPRPGGSNPGSGPPLFCMF